MINVEVEFTAQLRQRMGFAKSKFVVPKGSSLEELLIKIVQEGGNSAKDLLLGPGGKPATTLLCFADSEQVDPDHSLVEGQKITLMTPISGG